MGSYILQREKYLSKVVELRSEGMGYGRISKIIPVPEEKPSTTINNTTKSSTARLCN